MTDQDLINRLSKIWVIFDNEFGDDGLNEEFNYLITEVEKRLKEKHNGK